MRLLRSPIVILVKEEQAQLGNSMQQLPSAEVITRKAKSNLAFAFATLPRKRRRDAVTFYAFCRWVDDLADDEVLPLAQRRLFLERWYKGCRDGFSSLPHSQQLEQDLDEVVERRQISRMHLQTIVEGMVDDLSPARFHSIADVEKYNWKVACCVGLVSIRIFGCQQKRSEEYAVSLGQALQWTNILRDVGEDLRERQRLYLPEEELEKFQLSKEKLLSLLEEEKPEDAAVKLQEREEIKASFQQLMQHLSKRALLHFDAALAARCRKDRCFLVAAEAMRRIYHALLMEMIADGFQVFEKRYSLPWWKKMWLLFKPIGR